MIRAFLAVLGAAVTLHGCRCLLRKCIHNQVPKVFGGIGNRMQAILARVPLLRAAPQLQLPSVLQLFLFTVQMIWQERHCDFQYEFEIEAFSVTLPGDSTEGCADRVHVKWLLGRRTNGHPGGLDRKIKNRENGHTREQDLPPDAPIVLLTPGLNCYTSNLPGTAIYASLLERPWRVGVFEKRGVGGHGAPTLQAPTFHMFGHPSDLHVVVQQVTARWPDAPLHLVGMSSGNGLSASYLALHAQDVPNLQSALLLLGGEDYNAAFMPPRGNWLSRLVFDTVLLPSSKERMLRRNETVLRAHNAQAFEAALAAKTMQKMYDISMEHFSGYADRREAERRINPFFGGSNECMLEYKVPCLVCFAEDDPVAPGGPHSSWLDVISKCGSAVLALYPSGSHLGCYENWKLSRWVDKLALEWIEAVQATPQ